jgi:hypothetical protein
MKIAVAGKVTSNTYIEATKLAPVAIMIAINGA